jgi:hypothetical protein
MLFMLLLVENSASGNDSAGDGYVDTYSMINIIATPDLFAGKNIRTIGVATIGFEVGVGVNGIGLSFEGFKISEARKRSLHMKHVLVEGTYVPWQPEAPLFWRGSLKDLKLIYALEDVEIVQPE